MDDQEVGKLWEENAGAWTTLTRLGYDRHRDLVNSPAFLALLPEIAGLEGLDIGCGEGHNTRLMAGRGARMSGIDIAIKFIDAAREREEHEPLGIRYQAASALSLPFEDGQFDFATAIMSLMDMPGQEQAVREAHRVIRPGGFFQFSILHPCFATPRWKWITNAEGQRVALECGDYFDNRQGAIEEWTYGALPAELKEQFKPFRVAYFQRPLSEWLNLVLDAGFALERFAEPHASEELALAHPEIADTRVIAYFLIVRARKNIR